MSEVDDMDKEGFFDDADAIDAVASEVTDDADVEAATVEEPKSKLVNVSEKKAELSSAGLSFDFASLSSLPGVVVGQTGIEVSRFPVEKAKFSKGQRSLISILSDSVIVAKTHYDEDIGNFLCFGGDCCKSDLARVRYVYPIVRYETDAKGKPTSMDLKNMSLVVGQDTYQTLLDIQELKGSLTNFDLLVSCSDEAYQKITLQEAGPARYRKSEKCVREIKEFWAENSAYILKSTARLITPQDYLKAKSAEATSSDSVDFEDVFH